MSWTLDCPQSPERCDLMVLVQTTMAISLRLRSRPGLGRLPYRKIDQRVARKRGRCSQDILACEPIPLLNLNKFCRMLWLLDRSRLELLPSPVLFTGRVVVRRMLYMPRLPSFVRFLERFLFLRCQFSGTGPYPLNRPLVISVRVYVKTVNC